MHAPPAPTDLRSALLADICAHPADDTPRFVLADWLEDNGEAEGAEFVRVQVELASWAGFLAVTPESQRHLSTLRRRERELLAWLDVDALPVVEGLTRSNVLGAGTGGLGWYPRGQTTPNPCVAAEFRRGFVAHVTLPLAAWLEHAQALVLAQPITSVRLSDREPFQTVSEPTVWVWNSAWSDDTLATLRHCLPIAIWGCLPHRQVSYHTPDAAHAALSRACVTRARQAAGLPALEITP